jgi:hypothetical protein
MRSQFVVAVAMGPGVAGRNRPAEILSGFTNCFFLLGVREGIFLF